MKNLKVIAQGISLHIDTNDDSQPITNKLILCLLSYEINGQLVICQVPQESPAIFCLPYFLDPPVYTNPVQEGNETFSQAIYTCILESVARQRMAVCRIHLLFL